MNIFENIFEYADFCFELYNKSMPKAVDIYVLETKIGSGQFGDVFRGYSKVDGTDVAVKTIKRDKIKGNYVLTQGNLQNCSKTKFKY